MQEITPTSGVKGQPPITPKKEAKTPEKLYNLILDWVDTNSKREALTEALVHLEILSHEKAGVSKEDLAQSLIPEDPVAFLLKEKLEVARQSIPRAHALLETKDFEALIALFAPFVEGKALPRGIDEKFQSHLSSLLNAQTEEGTIGELVLQHLLADNKEGRSLLQKIAFTDPPNPLATHAKRLLSNNQPLQKKRGPKEFSTLFEKNKTSIQSIIRLLEESHSPAAVYQTYLQELEDKQLTTTAQRHLTGLLEPMNTYLKGAIDLLMQKVGRRTELAKLQRELSSEMPESEPLKTAGLQVIEEYKKLREEEVLNPTEHAAFLAHTAASLDKLLAANQTERKKTINEMAEVQKKMDVYSSLERQLNTVQTFLSQAKERALTQKEMEELSKTLLDVGVNYRGLDPDEKKEIDAIFTALSNLKTTEGRLLPTVVAEAMHGIFLQEHSQLQQQKSVVKPYGEWVQSKATLYESQKMNNPFVPNVLANLSKPPAPSGTPKETNLEETAASNAVNKVQVVVGSYGEKTDALQAGMNGMQKSLSLGDAMQQNVGFAANATASQQLSSAGDSGVSDFSALTMVTVLDKVTAMFNQEMLHLAGNMHDSNSARAKLISIINNMTSFALAGTTYDLGKNLTGSTMGQTAGVYNYSPSIVQVLLKNESTQAATDLADLQKLVPQLSNLVTLLTQMQSKYPPGKFPPQLAQLLTDAQTMQQSIPTLITTFTSLQTSLSNLTTQVATQTGKGAKTTTLSTTDVANLSNAEGIIANGETIPGPGGTTIVIQGLTAMHDAAQNDSQNLATLSQSEQMKVQLMFTEESQLWQAIATLLSNFHDMMNAPIQAIAARP